jgi:bacterioferritin-associated ferredoxin
LKLKVDFNFRKAMIVCVCRRVSDQQIRAAVAAGARTVEEVGACCRAGTGCGACHEVIEGLIQDQDCERLRLKVLSPYLQRQEAA